MSRIVSIAAVVVVGLACISTNAFAFRGAGVGHRGVGAGRPGVGVGGVHRHPVARGAAVGTTVAVGAAAAGAYYRPACGYYPYPPCYY